MEHKHLVFTLQGRGAPVLHSEHHYELDATKDAELLSKKGYDGFVVEARVFKAEK